MSVLKYVSLILPNSKIDKLTEKIKELEEEKEQLRTKAISYQLKLEKAKLEQPVDGFIVDSANLFNLLYEYITPLIPMDRDYVVYVHLVKNRLWFGTQDSSINIICDDYMFSVCTKLHQLRKLFSILTKIERQPITISFNNHGFINIQSLNI